MPIAALPSATVRSLGSSQVIVDSFSVIKELLDNAIDAHATSILVDVSSNCLDILQVKDNGYGIAPEDRDLVCKRYCTSKIQHYDDINEIGGQVLGFRGEALASLADMSGLLSVATKVEGEATGVSLKFSRSGEIKSQDLISNPVGTTIRVQDFLSSLPVRRQTVLKSANKILYRIKLLLQDYAIAKPVVRITFKVLKAKSEKGNWSYVPKRDAITLDAAGQVYSRSLSAALSTANWPKDQHLVNSTSPGSIDSPPKVVCIDALLPLPTCDIGTITHTRQHILVDGRPLSSARGVQKQITSLYKAYLAAASKATVGSLASAFLYMNITCSVGMYDINIEPTKDDVLFVQPELILSQVESLLEDFYGRLPASSALTENVRGKEPGIGELELLMNKGRHCERSIQPEKLGVDARNLNSRHRQSTLKDDQLFVGSSTEDDSFNSERLEDNEAHEIDQELELRQAAVSNPWTIAKMNAPVCSNKSSPQKRQLPTPEREKPIGIPEQRAGDSDWLLSHTSLGTTSSPVRDLGSGSFSPVPFPYPLTARNRRQVEDINEEQTAPQRQPLDLWVQHSPTSNNLTELDGFVAASSLNLGTRVSDLPEAVSHRRRRTSPQKYSTHVREADSPERMWFGHTPHTSRTSSKARGNHEGSNAINAPSRQMSQNRSQPVSISQDLPSEAEDTHPDLASVLDYEHRKAMAMQEHRLHRKKQTQLPPLMEKLDPKPGSTFLLSPHSSPAASSSPHRNRYNKARAALQSSAEMPDIDDNVGEEQIVSAFQDRDPRYKMIQALDEEVACPRIQDLPLERITVKHCTRDIIQFAKSADLIDIKALNLLASSDSYVARMADNDHVGFSAMSRSGEISLCSKRWAVTLAGIAKIEACHKVDVMTKLSQDIGNALGFATAP